MLDVLDDDMQDVLDKDMLDVSDEGVFDRSQTCKALYSGAIAEAASATRRGKAVVLYFLPWTSNTVLSEPARAAFDTPAVVQHSNPK